MKQVTINFHPETAQVALDWFEQNKDNLWAVIEHSCHVHNFGVLVIKNTENKNTDIDGIKCTISLMDGIYSLVRTKAIKDAIQASIESRLKQ